MNKLIFFAALFTSFSLTGCKQQQVPVSVEITKTNGGFQLLRNGEPYFIKGAVASGYFNKILPCCYICVRNETEWIMTTIHWCKPSSTG